LEYSHQFGEQVFHYAAAAYAFDPLPCLWTINPAASVVLDATLFCDSLNDTCREFIAIVPPSYIVLSVRGTFGRTQFAMEIIQSRAVAACTHDGVKVNAYFLNAFRRLDAQAGLTDKLIELKRLHPDYTLLFTGHSLGGAIASLAADLYALKSGTTTKDDLLLVTFGQPRVGNAVYAQRQDSLVPNTWRVVHGRDMIPHMPPKPFGYYHSGTEFWYREGMGVKDDYEECDGLLTQPLLVLSEDRQCSDSVPERKLNEEDHLHYYGRYVSQWGKEGCPAEEFTWTR